MKKAQDMKAFNIRLSKELWLFVKKTSAEQETSMMNVISLALNKLKKSYEKKLTRDGADV